MLFEEKHFGQPISEELAMMIRKNVSTTDYFKAAMNSDVGHSVLRQVALRSAALTERNSIGVIELIKIALQNSKEQYNDSRQSMEYFEDKLEQVEC